MNQPEIIIATRKCVEDTGSGDIYLQLVQVSKIKWVVRKVMINKYKVMTCYGKNPNIVTFHYEFGPLCVEINHDSFWVDEMLEIINFGKEMLESKKQELD